MRVRLTSTLVLSALLTACRQAATVDDQQLRRADADTANWLSYGRTQDEQRFSPLTAVNETTVTQLGPAWSYKMPTTRGHEATPLVHDGVMYVTSAWSLLHALDARTGAERWVYDPEVPKAHSRFACCDVVNRGAALYGGKVYLGTLDGRLVAVDMHTGRLAWQVRTTPEGTAYTITGAPRIARGRVIIGNSGAEFGVRGYVSAYDAASGELVWRTYTVPGDPAQPFESAALRTAASTWSGEWWKAGGGGTVWDAIVYDPDLDLVYIGTGNGSPWYRRLRSADQGDNLYLSSIIALRAETGEQVWHFQTTPGDNWDYTATQPLMLAELEIDGRARKVIMQAPKNGFFYVLDRITGEFISAKPLTAITWATGIDESGRPIEAPGVRELDFFVSPGDHGVHNWHPMSFSPATGLVYLPIYDSSQPHLVDTTWTYDARRFNVGWDSRRWPTWNVGANKTRNDGRTVAGRLIAWDPVKQREAWHVEQPLPLSGGTLATAGGLVFQGRADGMFRAYRATDGAVLWEYALGVGTVAPPIAYAVNGEQYVAVLSGFGGPTVLWNAPLGKGTRGRGMVVAFKLGGSAAVAPDTLPAAPPVPPPAIDIRPTRAEYREGEMLFGDRCAQCHGGAAVSGGLVPDLRYSTAAVHTAFEEIARGGQRVVLGMPSFAQELSAEQVRLIQAYVVERARETRR